MVVKITKPLFQSLGAPTGAAESPSKTNEHNKDTILIVILNVCSVPGTLTFIIHALQILS